MEVICFFTTVINLGICLYFMLKMGEVSDVFYWKDLYSKDRDLFYDNLDFIENVHTEEWLDDIIERINRKQLKYKG